MIFLGEALTINDGIVSSTTNELQLIDGILDLTALSSSSKINAKVELYEGSTLVAACTCNDRLQDFKVERIGQNKFFGFGIVHKLSINLIDLERNLTITKENTFKVHYINANNDAQLYPTFYVSEINRDETTNTISVVAYDKLQAPNTFTVKDLELVPPYTIKNFVNACAAKLGISIVNIPSNISAFNTYYPTGANFDGTEPLRSALDDVAEVTQCIYHLNNADELVYKQLDKKDDPLLTIGKNDYYDFNSGENTKLATIASVTELGDNVDATATEVIRGGGKNLLPYPYYETTKTINGITFIDNGNGTITANGTATANAEFYFTGVNPSIELEHLKYYYFSGRQGIEGIVMFSEYTDDSGTVKQQRGRIVWRNTYTLNRFFVRVEEGTTLENAVIQPMVEQSASETEYEPYKRHISIEGVTEYVRDNPFWENRIDIGVLVDNAVAAVGGMAINQFYCNWDGNYLLEIGDKIAVVTEDNNIIVSYILNDVITFTGVLSEDTQWTYDENASETASNPSSLGEKLNQTFARVDKANREINLLVKEVGVNKSTTNAELQNIKENQTSFTQTATDITLRVETIETKGATRVDTGTGFTFNEEGLRINKDNSGIENLIDNTGMYVKQDGQEVLVANENGVKAKDLHATTYLWIGSHSRFEDYEGGRTGCFWIGK